MSIETPKYEPTESKEASLDQQVDIQDELKAAYEGIVLNKEQQDLIERMNDTSLSEEERDQAEAELLTTVRKDLRDKSSKELGALMTQTVMDRAAERQPFIASSREEQAVAAKEITPPEGVTVPETLAA